MTADSETEARMLRLEVNRLIEAVAKLTVERDDARRDCLEARAKLRDFTHSIPRFTTIHDPPIRTNVPLMREQHR